MTEESTIDVIELSDLDEPIQAIAAAIAADQAMTSEGV